MGEYSVILADPPWKFLVRSEKGKGRSAEQHYQCMSIKEICELWVPHEVAAKNCVLFLWVTDPFLPIGFEVISSWGFTYKTVGFYWVKTVKDRNDFLRPNDFPIGGGYWTRANPELCLLATRGNPTRKSKGVRRLITASRREHSRKPDEVYPLIEELVEGPYFEMFARQSRPGWTAWGNEVEKFNGLR